MANAKPLWAFTRLRFYGDTYGTSKKYTRTDSTIVKNKSIMGYLTYWDCANSKCIYKIPKTTIVHHKDLHYIYLSSMTDKEFKIHLVKVKASMLEKKLYTCANCDEPDLKAYEILFNSGMCCECYFTKYHGFNRKIFPPLTSFKKYDPNF